jgi:dTDP-4-dehydrorhamnose 3,5-epimerase
MKFSPTALAGVYVVEPEPREDQRGFFARAWCEREFADQGLTARPVQANISYNRRRGTLRGLHYQGAPYGECKLVRVTRGAIYDVVLDLRPASLTHGRWIAVELHAESYRMLYVPEDCAQGFQTLADDTEVGYQVSQFYTPAAERGVRYDDAAFGIQWPLAVTAISDKDAAWPDYRPAGRHTP